MFKISFANISQSFIKFGIDLLCLKEFTNSRFRSCTCSCMFYKTDEFSQMGSDIWKILSLTCLSTYLETSHKILLFLELIYCAYLILQNRVSQQIFRNCIFVFKHLFLSTGKWFFRNSFSDMLIYMSKTFPQNFIIFGVHLLF